jgi:hypothetical protein
LSNHRSFKIDLLLLGRGARSQGSFTDRYRLNVSQLSSLLLGNDGPIVPLEDSREWRTIDSNLEPSTSQTQIFISLSACKISSGSICFTLSGLPSRTWPKTRISFPRSDRTTQRDLYTPAQLFSRARSLARCFSCAIPDEPACSTESECRNLCGE